MAVAAEQITYKDQAAKLPPKPDVAIDTPRYVACLGDFIEAIDKVQLRSIGARSGGLRIGSSDTEGCPTMWRTDYLIRRGAFTPLEMTVIPAKDDEKIHGDKPKPVGERVKYPGSDITFVTDDEFRKQGVVEITALRGVLWASETPKALNLHFFPDLGLWLRGEKEFPKYLRIYEEMVRAAQIETDAHVTTQSELLESARAFRAYGLTQIEFNRQRILSTRNVDMGGFAISWSGRARLFAEQLEVKLEDENEIAPPTSSSPTDERHVAALEEANVLKREELDILRGKAHPSPVPPVEAAPQPIVVSSTQCSATTNSGEQCQRTAVKDGRCALPAHRIEDVTDTENPQVTDTEE